MKRLLKTSSITGSAVVPAAYAALRSTTRSSTRWSRSVTRASHSGSTMVVALRSAMIAGPAMTEPGKSLSREYIGVSWRIPPVVMPTRAIGSALAMVAGLATLNPAGASAPPTAGAAEAGARVLGDVVAALHGDELDGVGHVGDGDADVAFGDAFGRLRPPGRGLDLFSERRELLAHHLAVELLVAAAPEDAREVLGLDLAQHHVAVGHGERAAAAVARGPGIGRRRIRADPLALAVEEEDRAAARGDGVDRHHRRAHAHARDLRLEFALELARVVRHVGRGAAHVEADPLPEARGLRGAHHADDAARGTGEDRVLALEAVRVGESAIGLHEHKSSARQLRGHLVDISPQDRREIRVDHRRVPARDDLHQRRHSVRGRDLLDAGVLRELRHARFVRRITVAVHEHDRDRLEALLARRLQVADHRRLLNDADHSAAPAHAPVHLCDRGIQHLRHATVPVADARAGLVGAAPLAQDAARAAEHAPLSIA